MCGAIRPAFSIWPPEKWEYDCNRKRNQRGKITVIVVPVIKVLLVRGVEQIFTLRTFVPLFVPVYVLEFLLEQYCSSDDEEIIEDGVQKVKRILSDSYMKRSSLILPFTLSLYSCLIMRLTLAIYSCPVQAVW